MRLRLIPLGAFCALASLATPASPARAADSPPPLAVEASVLTLDEALARTLRSNPTLSVAREEMSAATAGVQLAGRLPNPELTISLENVAGEGSYRDSASAELTIEVSQPLELGGKRQLRRAAAELGRQLATNDQTLARATVVAATRQKFTAVLAAQEGLALATEQVELADKALAAAEERITAGKAPGIDRMRLRGEAGLARLAVARAERSLLTARLALAAGWGEIRPDFGRVEGNLAELPAAPADPPAVEAAVEQSVLAENRRLATELVANELAQARAGRIPDPSLTVGWRQFEESDGSAWLFGVTVPLPLFSQGNDQVAAAGSRLNAARAREQAARLEARAAWQSAWQTFVDTRTEAETLASQVVPAAAEGFAAAEFGYRAGKFGLLELLDAQRAVFEARQRQLDAQTASHLAAIELQRLLGHEPATVVTTQPSAL